MVSKPDPSKTKKRKRRKIVRKLRRHPVEALPPRNNGNHPGGRPPKYHPDIAIQAGRLCKLGATDDDMAEFFEVSPITILNWKNTYPEFLRAVTRGKDRSDDLVERRHFERAVGYVQPAVRIFLPPGETEPVIVHCEEHIPPDVGAQKNWLSNRRPEQWRHR